MDMDCYDPDCAFCSGSFNGMDFMTWLMSVEQELEDEAAEYADIVTCMLYDIDTPTVFGSYDGDIENIGDTVQRFDMFDQAGFAAYKLRRSLKS